MSARRIYMSDSYQVAAYYFPNYHIDPRNEKWHGHNWTEWELVKRAEPRFAGHQQPKVPLWGYEDEADPSVMAKKIDAAADHAISTFLFDWYWHKEGPYLQRALDEGFLKAPNNSRMKFALMWANHDWVDIHPATRSKNHTTLAEGCVAEDVFVKATRHMIDHYFGHPSYWKVNGGLYVSFYELMSLVKGLGSLENTRRLLDDFRTRVRLAGHGELHLNAVVWGVQILPTETKIEDPVQMLKLLGFDSVTSYVWIHHQVLSDFPKTDYDAIREASCQDYDTFTKKYPMDYFPNVTMGWDSSPRTIQSDSFDNLGYPYMPILEGNTPAAFQRALESAKQFLDKGELKEKILTINAWNEWTEGSYLEPDMIHGYKYLEAIRKVFGC